MKVTKEDESCPHMNGCPLYGKFLVKKSLKVWKIFYCEGNYRKCKRYQLSAEGKPVPDLLLPSGDYLGKLEN